MEAEQLNKMIDTATTTADYLGSKKTLEQLQYEIINEIPYVNIKPYSHNIIGLKLKIMGDTFGKQEVYDIVNNTELKSIGWGHMLDLNSNSV